MRLVVIDTNVLVSGLLGASRDSPPRFILEALVRGSLRFAISEALLVEYRQVLLRPRILACHGLSEREVDRLLAGLVVNASIREVAPVDTSVAMQGDAHVIALLRAVPDPVLVTGDGRLAEEVEPWCLVCTPAEFLAAEFNV